MSWSGPCLPLFAGNPFPISYPRGIGLILRPLWRRCRAGGQRSPTDDSDRLLVARSTLLLRPHRTRLVRMGGLPRSTALSGPPSNTSPSASAAEPRRPVELFLHSAPLSRTAMANVEGTATANARRCASCPAASCQWGWVTDVGMLAWTDLESAPTRSQIGAGTSISQHSHIRLPAEAFHAAERLFEASHEQRPCRSTSSAEWSLSPWSRHPWW